MEKLKTPFGDIIVKIDGKEVGYKIKKYENDPTCPNLLGRYLIEIEFKPTGKEHKITCEIAGNKNLKAEIEPGEMLECLSFYSEERIKMSIGVYGEVWGYVGGELYKPSNDYDIDYLSRGMSCIVLEDTKTEKFYFGVSWIDDVGYYDPTNDDGHDRDVETWYGSDPCYLIK